MAIHDPKSYMDEPEKPAPLIFTLDQLKELMVEVAKAGRIDDEMLRKQATMQAEENAKFVNPVIKPHPAVSDYNPLGDRDYPRPESAYAKMSQNGGELFTDMLAYEEIAALNALTEGKYVVTKADGTPIECIVTVERSVGSKGTLDVTYPCKDEHKQNHKPLFDYCVDMVGQAGGETLPLITLKQKLDAVRTAYRLRRERRVDAAAVLKAVAAAREYVQTLAPPVMDVAS